MDTRVKWMDEAGNEVDKEKATHALVTTFDDKGQLVDESYGTVEVADQE